MLHSISCLPSKWATEVDGPPPQPFTLEQLVPQAVYSGVAVPQGSLAPKQMSLHKFTIIYFRGILYFVSMCKKSIETPMCQLMCKLPNFAQQLA